MMGKKINILLLLAFAVFVTSCKKKEIKTVNDYNKGKISILTDDSFKSVTEALADAYMINYPETKVNVKVVKEDLALMDLLKGNSKLIVMSRDLTPEEISEYKRITDLDYRQDKFAADAVLFIVPKSSARGSISVEEVKQMLNSDNKNLIFDGTNSSNLNFVAQKLGKKPEELKYSIISGNENVVAQLSKFPDKIGVVSLNTLSRPYGKNAELLRDLVKILPVEDKGKVFEPSGDNLRQMQYPFTRILYFLNNEGNFQIANGIIRFSCTQLGQMVVEKEGLQPYNIFKREVQMR